MSTYQSDQVPGWHIDIIATNLSTLKYTEQAKRVWNKWAL